MENINTAAAADDDDDTCTTNTTDNNNDTNMCRCMISAVTFQTGFESINRCRSHVKG